MYMVDQFASKLSEWKEMSEDQHRNTNMNDKDHLVGQLTSVGPFIAVFIVGILFQAT